MVMVTFWLSLQETNESQFQCRLAYMFWCVCVCGGVCLCVLVCVVHEKKISSTNGKFFLSWIRL